MADSQCHAVAPPKPVNRDHLLVVDDEQAILRLFQMILRMGLPSCEVELASNGAEALERFKAGHHGVLLMDLHMPVMDGCTAYVEIDRWCREQNWDYPRIIFCTGYAPPDRLQSLVEQDERLAILNKPVTAQELLDAIRSRLEEIGGGSRD